MDIGVSIDKDSGSPKRVFGRRPLCRRRTCGRSGRRRRRVHRLDEPRLQGAFLHLHPVCFHHVFGPFPFRWRTATVQFQHDSDDRTARAGSS